MNYSNSSWTMWPKNRTRQLGQHSTPIGLRFVCILFLAFFICCSSRPNVPPNTKSSTSPRSVADSDLSTDEPIGNSSDESHAENAAKVDPTKSQTEVVEPGLKDANEKETEASPQPSEENPASDVETPKTDANSGEAETDSEPGEITETKIPTERFVLLTQTNPLVVDVQVFVGEQSATQLFESSIDEVLQLADADQDGTPKWDEVSKLKLFQYGIMGNVEFRTERQQHQMVETYDTDRDGVMDRGEVPRFLTRNAGGSRSFSLDDTNFYRYRGKSPIFDLLDEDDDQNVSLSEIATAGNRLASLDPNNDEVIQLEEFGEGDEVRYDRLPNRRRTGHHVARLINSSTRWDVLLQSFRDTYQDQVSYLRTNTLSESSFPLTPSLASKLDTNQDKKIDRKELANLAKIEAHLKLKVEFDTADGGNQITLVNVSDELDQFDLEVSESENQLVIIAPQLRLAFFVNDTLARMDNETSQNAFAQLDQDGNGYLDLEEVERQGNAGREQFELADTDKNEKVYPDEFAVVMKRRQLAQRCQIRSRAADEPDQVFSALDKNYDGRLTARELAAAENRLAAWDANNDDNLSLEEVPHGMVVGFARGNPQQLNDLFILPSNDRVAEDLPLWFRRMDINRDEDISRREFLGDPIQFDELDKDGDGFLSRADIEEAPLEGGEASQ